MRHIASLVATLLLSSPAFSADLHGWILSPPPLEENVYVDQEIWTLTPPDGRPPTSLRASVAERVNNGSLSPEAAYLGREAKAAAAGRPESEGNEDSLPGRSPASPDKGLAMDDSQPGAGADTPEPHTTPPPPADPAPVWNPDGTTKPYYEYEKTKLACEKAHRVTQPSWTKELALKNERPTWSMPEGNLVPSCKEADLAEMMKREAYSICSSDEAKRWGHMDQKNAKAAWVSGQQTWSTPHGEIGTAHGVLTCYSGYSYEVFMKLGEYENECWICGINGSLNKNEADVARKKAKMKDVDITKGPRTSPHEAEFPEIPGYWKQ